MWSGSDTTSGLQVGGSDATSYITGLPLIERWPFYNGRCWYLHYITYSLGTTDAIKFRLSCDCDGSRHNVCDGESFDSVPYIAVTRHSWCAQDLHLTSYWQIIGDEVQAASGYCISFVYRDYGHHLSSTFGNGSWESAKVQPMSFPNHQHIVTYNFYFSNFANSQLSHGCRCNLVRECGARVTYWCRLKAISWRYGVCRSVYLWDSWWGGTSTDLYICEANAMSHSSRQFWWEHCTNFIRSWSLWYVRQYNGRNRK